MTIILKNNENKVDLAFIRAGSAHPGFSTASKRRVAQSFLETPQKDSNKLYPSTSIKKFNRRSDARNRNNPLRQSITKTMILNSQSSLSKDSVFLKAALSNDKHQSKELTLTGVNKLSHPQYMDLD